jgi:hypothetical protein
MVPAPELGLDLELEPELEPVPELEQGPEQPHRECPSGHL